MRLEIRRFGELGLEGFYEIAKLRVSVFVVEQNSPYQEIDEDDRRACHLSLRGEDGAIAAYARVMDRGRGLAALGRVIAVRRGEGLGRRIFQEALRFAVEGLGAERLVLEAQVQARGFYEKFGFVQSSEPFLDGGVPHVVMTRIVRGEPGGPGARKAPLPGIRVLRATENWQRAGAFYVRVQAMARRHGISLDREFDERDGEGSRHIVLLDGDFPIATCRLYGLDGERAAIGRVVVLEEWRRLGLGRRLVREAEAWARELGFTRAVIESRVEKLGFYASLGYVQSSGEVLNRGTFDCLPMERELG